MSDLSREEPASPKSPLHVAAPLAARPSAYEKQSSATKPDDLMTRTANSASFIQLLASLDTFDQALHSWRSAYPEAVFPRPDFIRVNEVLSEASLSLSSVSAANMLHVATKLDEAFEPIRLALRELGKELGLTA